MQEQDFGFISKEGLGLIVPGDGAGYAIEGWNY